MKESELQETHQPINPSRSRRWASVNVARGIALLALATSLTLLSACGERVAANFQDKTPVQGVSLVAEPAATLPVPRIPSNCTELIPYTAPRRHLIPGELLQLVQDVKGVLRPNLLNFNSCEGDSFENISDYFEKIDGTYIESPNAMINRLSFVANTSEKVRVNSTYKDGKRLTTRLGVEDIKPEILEPMADDKLLDYASQRIILPRDITWQWSNRIPFQGARILEGVSQSASSRYSISNARGVYVEMVP